MSDVSHPPNIRILFIEDEEIIKKILKHLNLLQIENHDPPSNFEIPPRFKKIIDGNSGFDSCNSTHLKSNSKLTHPNNYTDYTKNYSGAISDDENSSEINDYDICDEMPKYEEWF